MDESVRLVAPTFSPHRSAKQGLALKEACSGWAESMSRRRDERVRREMRMRCPRSPFVIPEDVRSLNRTAADPARQGRRTAEIFYPDEPAEGQLKVELVPPWSKRDYSKLGPPARKKRKRRSRGKEDGGRGDASAGPTGADEIEDESGGWRTSKDGKRLLKRGGRQMIRKPVDDADGAAPDERRGSRQSSRECSVHSSLSSLLASASDGEPDGGEERPVRAPTRLKCEGRRVAALLRHLVDALSTETAQTPAMVNIAERCCDLCRADASMLECLVGDFTRIASSLEGVFRHRLGSADVECEQPPGTIPSTPRVARRPRAWLPVAEDSDEGEDFVGRRLRRDLV